MHARIRRIRHRRRWRRLLDLQRFRRDERGLQLVEVTIVIPIFLILFAATAEFGRYFYEYTTLAKAARVGCRYLATVPVDPDVEDANAKKLIVYGNINGTGSPILPGLELTDVEITRQGEYATTIPDTVTVTIVGYPHQPIFDLGALTKTVGLSMAVDVKPSVRMRYLLTQPPPIE
jgi:Flp pilus assembly protein TadG